MAKNLVLTIAVGPTYERMKELTHPTIKAYAERIGADFLSIDSSHASTPHWEKFQIHDLLNTYQRILYIDTDIIVRSDTPNIFDLVPESQLGMFNELPFTQDQGRHISFIDACKDYGVVLKKWDGRYFNSGVMVIPRSWKFLFKKPDKELFNFYEQGYLNVSIHQELEKIGNELSVFDLPYTFNRMACMDPFTGEERYASYMIHYAGFPDLQHVLGLIETDLGVWKSNNNGFKYQRHLILDVQGGLGDQVEAQPGIRYLIKHVYPGDDINILTHYPLLFENMGANVFLHGDFQRKLDTPYYSVNTLPGPETVMWGIVSNLLCHTADYCSMAMLRRTIPNLDKNIILNVKDEVLEGVKKICGEDLENLVVVHAGKHWESKTFPTDWWQSVVDGLHKEGFKVCLVGKNDLTRGVLPVVAHDGVVDARDLLNLEEFTALLSKAKILLSNDSAPVHLAGAFNNWIVLIPSCKHPDHIIPFRNGVQYEKAKALYKRLVLDDTPSAPTEVHGSSGRFINDDWSKYLPEVDDVIKEIKLCKEDVKIPSISLV